MLGYLYMKPDNKINCPIARVAALLSDTWTMLILRDLLKKRMRFTELCVSLNGISTRTLTLKLKRLEDMEIIENNDLYYSITKSGKKIEPILEEMSLYGRRYLKCN